MTVFESLMETKTKRGGGFFLLLDPDRSSLGKMLSLVEAAEESGVDAILVGSSLTISSGFDKAILEIKKVSSIPVIIFPGTHSQISSHADAILFTSLISGRNPAYLIDEQVKGAPLVKEYGLEPIATGYLLIESGRVTSVQYISNTLPIPADKNDIACAHALAAKYMGMKMIFMEAGSGAERAVPESMIQAVDSYVELPIIVGGGIKEPEEVRSRITAGASFVVVGNHFEDDGDTGFLREFADAAHPLDLITA